jgi:hypothetical protein
LCVEPAQQLGGVGRHSYGNPLLQNHPYITDNKKITIWKMSATQTRHEHKKFRKNNVLDQITISYTKKNFSSPSAKQVWKKREISGKKIYLRFIIL